MAKNQGRRGSSPEPPSEAASPTDVGREVQIEMQAVTWQAPMPPPEILHAYDSVIQNGAERLFKQFEIEAEERRALTRRNQTHQLINALSGRLCALVFALSALGVSAYALSRDHSISAAVIGGAAIALVVAAFTGIPAIFRQRMQSRGKAE